MVLQSKRIQKASGVFGGPGTGCTIGDYYFDGKGDENNLIFGHSKHFFKHSGRRYFIIPSKSLLFLIGDL